MFQSYDFQLFRLKGRYRQYNINTKKVQNTKTLLHLIEQIQRWATKYILNLPSLCEESYKDRLIELALLPVSYWHEYLDMFFFFKSVTGLVKVNPTVIPTRRTLSRATRSSSNTNVTLFVPKRCKTTYQRSFSSAQ